MCPEHMHNIGQLSEDEAVSEFCPTWEKGIPALLDFEVPDTCSYKNVKHSPARSHVKIKVHTQGLFTSVPMPCRT